MSADKPPKGNKPFLGEEELSSALDAWDEMFDNLHGGPEGDLGGLGADPQTGAASIGPADVIDAGPGLDTSDADVDVGATTTDLPMAWDEPPAAGERGVSHADASRTIDDFGPGFGQRLGADLDDGSTLDREIEPSANVPPPFEEPPSASSSFDRWQEPADETDFSDVGADGPPAALGQMLGSGEMPRFDDDDDAEDGGATRMDLQIRPPSQDDDDGVYTSASRPAIPPAPSPAQPSPARRTGPAIIRRTPVNVPIVEAPAQQRPTPQRGYPAQPSADDFADDFGGSTRIASLDELEARAEESLRAPDRSKAPTAPPPMSFSPSEYGAQAAGDDDDDYEIEIGGAQPEQPPEQAPRRTVAHTLRRDPTKATTSQPIRRESEPVIEIEHAAAPSPAGGEDDFSDVAAAVQDPDPDAPVDDPFAGFDEPAVGDPLAEDSFSDVAAAVGATGIPDDMMPATRSAPAPLLQPVPLADDDLDHDESYDHLPTRMIADDDAAGTSGDAYVPMGARLDDALAVPFADDEQPVPQVDEDYGVAAPAAVSDRPPALVDLYPRVKRPTSVPVMGGVPAAEAAPAGGSPPATFEQRPDVVENEPQLDLDALAVENLWPEQLEPLPSADLDEDAARMLMVIERELPTVDDPAASAALRIEAGRLCERVGDVDRARAHYDAALLADPRATAALRGLRRIARASGDLIEATRQLDAEIAVAGALERRPLGHYRIDLLLASGEHDLARVAVGELLDTAPSDVRALLAQLELAFLDGRADEFGRALEQLAHAVTDSPLRAAVQQARGILAARHNDSAAAVTWFGAAAESDREALAVRLAAIRGAAAQSNAADAARALVDLARTLAQTDPTTAAALALRAQHWEAQGTGAEAGAFALQVLPGDALVARVSAEAALAGADPLVTTQALTAWAASAAPTVERAYAAGRAAELDPAHGAELWAQVLAAEPGDDYAAAQLRTAHVAAEQPALAVEVDRQLAADPSRERATLRAAFGLVGQGGLQDAIAMLQQGHAAQPTSLPLADALGDALAAAGRWTERATLLASLATTPGSQLDPDVAQLRSALAWEQAVGAIASSASPDADELQRATAAGLVAWEKVNEQATGTAPEAHAAAAVLATRLGDRDVLAEVLARTQAVEKSTWARASLALRRARLAGDDPARVEAITSEISAQVDDPRRTVVQLLAAARKGELGDAVSALDERASLLGETTEAAAVRLRAAQLALDAGDAVRASQLFREVDRQLPDLPLVGDLLQAARRRAGESSGPVRATKESTSAASPDTFVRVIRDADDAVARGDASAALGLYQAALDIRPGDPLAATPLARVAAQLREPGPLAALALAQLRAAEAGGDAAATADAYELLSHIDRELRADPGAAQVALESASQADPTRVDLMHRLEREYTVADQVGELLRLRRAELEQVPLALSRDRAAMLMDTAGLAQRDGRADAELAELYRAALAADPGQRLALLHLESIVRRAGASEELARLEEQIAAYFEGDARTQAAFYTRAGETLAELGQIDAAVQKFGAADHVGPGYVPALEGWRKAALKGQLWLDVAEAASRQAGVADDAPERARLYHLAGVALMDKALMGEQAIAALRRALEAEPDHRDAFIRLRILLEEEGDHDQLAILIANRIEHEPAGPQKLELHRALAELSRNFLNDRDAAKHHYRAILDDDPNDLRAHAAIADIAWEQGAWQEAADALIARARLERDPEILKTLCYRLGLIYADRLVDVPMALKSFQRALSYNPDDEQTLVRLADLAPQAGEWKLALAACERLVKSEEDPVRRASHLHRVARIFKQGFGDLKRAERALNLALDNAPANDEALSELVRFYRESGDMLSVRVHLNRLAGTMRVRAGNDPRDGVAYRVISRAMAARAAVGVDGSTQIARAAAELAQLLGAADDPERLLLAEPMRVDLAPLLRPDADEVLFPRSVQGELRQMFTLLGDRIAKHVGVDLRSYGVGRGDRLRGRDSSVATHAQDVATGLGFGEIDVYVTTRQPYAMIAEPTSPVSLVIGQAIAQGDSRAIRFAAGSALKLAQSHLAIPARLQTDELGVLVVALMRLFHDKFPGAGLDEHAVTAQSQKLKRLIPTGLFSELRPYAFAIDPTSFDHRQLARDLHIAGMRAGVVAAGSLVAGLSVLAAQAGTDVPGFLGDPVAQGLISFAVSEDHATVSR